MAGLPAGATAYDQCLFNFENTYNLVEMMIKS